MKNNPEKKRDIFDSSSKYESGSFNKIDSDNLRLIADILSHALPVELEYELSIDTTNKQICLLFRGADKLIVNEELRQVLKDSLTKKDILMNIVFEYLD